MRPDPAFTSWVVRFPSAEEMRPVKDRLLQTLHGDLTVSDTVQACPSGTPVQSVELHRQGDYFTAVRLSSGPPEVPASFRLLFHRRPDAGRYWKDFMVRLLQMIRQRSPAATITLDYRGDEAPAESAGVPH